jgi:hypothetical protein
MTSISNGESGSSVRTKLNSSLTVTDAFTVSSGNVGIGASPTAGFKLDVVGNVTIGSNAGVGALTVRSMPIAINQLATTARFGANSDSYDFRIINAITSVGGSYVRLAGPTDGNSYMAFENAGSERVRIDASGNVGIGTSSPISIGGHTGVLTLFGSNATALALRDSVGGKDIRLNDGLLSITSTGGTNELSVDASGNVGIGTTSPNAASIVDAQSTTKGVRFPNMTTTQKAAIANVAGNVVFDTTLGKLCVNNGSAWQTITSV